MQCFKFLAPCLLALLAACSDSSDELAPVPEPPMPPAPVILEQKTFYIPSDAKPAATPGSAGVTVSNPKLLAHFGEGGPDLNNAVYTRYFLSDARELQPDAILVMMPGFEGGAANFAILADQLLRRLRNEMTLVAEVWAMDRRSEQLEDRVGLELAEQAQDPQIALNFLFGEALGLELSQPLLDGPNRRLIKYNTAEDLAFMANWTPLVHSLDIDAVVQRALSASRGSNVFLGGHSAGTGYVARYAATDFDFTDDAVDAGYDRLRGLILLEGGGGSIRGEPADEDLDRIEARFDGGLYGAVRDQASRCADGVTACASQSEAEDCAALTPPVCIGPTDAYATGLINTTTFAAGEMVALDGDLNGDSGLSILQTDQRGIEGNNALAMDPELLPVRILLQGKVGSSVSLYGEYLDDDGIGAAAAPFLATSIGAPGPEVDGLSTWLNIDEALPDAVLTDNGPPPTGPERAGPWGLEVERTDLKNRLLSATYRGETNFFDWYYPSSGLFITAGLDLDTTALSAPPPLGRGRSDIDNRTQAANINIPVIAFGGSNGLTTTPAAFLGFAEAIAACASESCDGMTPRVVDSAQPSEAFPSFGEIAGGFEVHISEGYSHVDVLTAEDGAGNQVIEPLMQFIRRNVQ